MPFFNIFSKKPEKESLKIKIIIDNREKNSLVASELVRQGFQIEFQQLPVADYLIGNTAIERKTISDFKSSIINKRLPQQLLEIKQYPKYFLILEGPQDEFYHGILHENAFRGFLLSVILEFNVPIIFTQSPEDTAKYLSVLAKKEPAKHTSLRPSKISFSREEQLQYILEGFPHVGPAKAKALLEKFKSLKAIFNAQEEDLRPILGNHAKHFCGLLDN